MNSMRCDDAHDVTTLPQALRVFFSRPGPKMIAAHAGLAWLKRIAAGPPRLAEVPLGLAVAAWWPLQEWLAHKHLLHWVPRDIGGVHVDPNFARVHRAHHRAPRGIDLTLLPIEVVLAAMAFNLTVWRKLSPDRRMQLTGMASYATMALIYEWTHFLVHTGYAPKSSFYARVRRNHRNHHHLNENYWLGFTWPGIDSLLGTEPDPRSVPRSETATRLHGLDD